MTSVCIVAHHQRPEAAALAASTAEWLTERGHEVWMPIADAAAVGLPARGSGRSAGSADLVISLGGDGTVLRAVQLIEGGATPVIGVNVGQLGYLTEIEPHALLASLELFLTGREAATDEPAASELDGDWRIEERMLLAARVRRRGGVDAEVGWRALNDVVLEKGESGHTVRLLVSIDGATFTSYAADGLIVATPTGSTAYSLSARGPVVSPQHRGVLVTPVSPHMLFDRSLVLDPDELIRVESIGYQPVEISVDGQRVATLAEGDAVECVAAAPTARFVRFGPRRFHQILKAKFGLTDR